MIWSFSASKLFFKCQRQWYFKYHFASANATKSPLRKEAHLLSKLDSVFAWRGKVVDQVIASEIISPLNYGKNLSQPHILQQARGLFDRQLAFAIAYRLRNPEVVISKAGSDFAALRDIEYEGNVSNDLITRAWDDIVTALSNLLAMEGLIGKLRTAKKLIPQRPLIFKLNGYASEPINIRAVPDLIAFFNDKPPLIIDWKVHAFGKIDYRLQLACYAMALTHCKPHKDFPPSLSGYITTDLDLLEVQLLTRRQRNYTLTKEDVIEVEAYIAETAKLMELAVYTQEGEPLTPLDFSVTRYPQTCASCSFKKICWENTEWKTDVSPEWKQMSLL